MGEGRNIIIDNPHGGYQVTGRIELLPWGKFTGKGDYFGSDLKREPSRKLSIGISGDLNFNAVRSRGNLGDFLTNPDGTYMANDIRTFIVDLMYKHKGWSVASEFATRSIENPENGWGTGTGFVAQGGYLLPSNWEFAGRFTAINGDNGSVIGDVDEYTIGVSKYIKGHNLKMQSDFSFQDIAGQANQTVFRLQTELAF